MFHSVVAKNTFYQTLAKSITAFLGFAITVIIARSFGVVGYGDFTKATAFVALFYLFVDLGLNAIYLQVENDKYENFKKIFYLRVVIALFVLVASNGIAYFLPFNNLTGLGFSPLVRMGIFIYSFSILSQSIINSTGGLFQKRLNYFPYFLSTVSGSLFNFLLITVLVYFKMPLLFILFSYAFSSFITAGLSLCYVRNKVFPVDFDFKFSKKIIVAAFPIGLMLIFNLIYFRADMFLLSVLRPTRDVGIYGLSYKFFDFILSLPLFLSNSLYPFLLSNKNDTKKFFNITSHYFLIFLGFSFFVVVPFWFLSPLLSLIKSDYLPAIVPFRILLLSVPLFFLTSFLQWILIALKEQKFLAWVYGVSTILNILLNLIFIPQYSYFASAVITGLSEGGVFVLLAFKVFSIKIFLEKERENE